VRSACRRSILAIAAIVILLFARLGVGQTSASSFVIRNARVFDGEKIIPGASVVVTDGKIAAVGSNVQAPSDARGHANRSDPEAAYRWSHR
jgi:hypothetical protein